MPKWLLAFSTVFYFSASGFAQDDLSKSELKRRAEAYRRRVLETVANVVRDPADDPATMMVSGIEALYARQSVPVSKELRGRLDRLRLGDPDQTLEFALLQLGDIPGLTFGRAFVVTVNGFRSAIDPAAGLVFQDMLISSPNGFRIGVELEGITLLDRIAYHVDLLNLDGLNRGEFVKPPVGPVWTISRVVPGSPAADAGMEPGDRIVKVEGATIDRNTNAKLFAKLTSSESAVVDRFGNRQEEVALRVTHESARTQSTVDSTIRIPYLPKVFHAPNRNRFGTPDFMLDRDEKFACIRVGAIENGSEQELLVILEALRSQGVKGLLLDLRWCPGGYVIPTTALVSQFLPAGTEISKMQPLQVGPFRTIPQPEVANGSYHPDWRTIPLAVLVNGETTGGGEMIAAAMQDHKRGVVIGQRTFGKANIMTALPTSMPGLSYRATNGYSLRPSGGMRHRFPTSKRDDPWGVKPNRGFEVPATPEQSSALLKMHEAHAVRRAVDRRVVAADDPAEDAQRLAALKLFQAHVAEGR